MEHSLTHAVAGGAAASGSLIQDIAWFVLFAPLVMGAGAWIFSRRNPGFCAALNLSGVLLSFCLSALLLAVFGGDSVRCSPFQWLPLEGFHAEMGLQLDRLSQLMLVVVTGVASLVMFFSTGYMKGDPGYSRFFCTLSLFVFSMLGIVLADNFLMMFVFWELVGVSSYLLIGFWNEKNSAADASKKAFLSNRLGDFGFLLGIILVWAATGSLRFDEIAAALAKNPVALGSMASLAGVLVFFGAMGKSAQFPLHVWLPDAMEGPTPVSALIHAATMVAAGVYMLCRVFFLYTLPAGWPEALSFLGSIDAAMIVGASGGVTALLAAVIAVQQNDIKRILAYSTLSQLGYMVMAVGAAAHVHGGNPSAAMYHLVTHAFFKAMLFLGAGSVIYACHHEQDIWKMGGLWSKMPATFLTFSLGTAALMGVPLLSGFYSKDEILATLLEGAPVLFVVAVVVAALTTIYMTRLLVVAFLGEPRSREADHAHETPKVMWLPLAILAAPSLMVAWLPLGDFLTRHFNPGFHPHGGGILFGPFNHNATAAFFGLGATVFGLSVAFSLYSGAEKDPLQGMLGRCSRWMRDRFYLDELYEATVVPLHDFFASLAGWVDEWIVNGLWVRGIAGFADVAGRTVRLFQTGNLQTYTFLFAAGVAFVVYLAARH